MVDQYALAMSAAGVTDGHVASDRSVVFEFTRFLGRPLWTAGPEDIDGFLRHQRKDRRLARSTVYGKSCALARFYDFLRARYQGEILWPTDSDNTETAITTEEIPERE